MSVVFENREFSLDAPDIVMPEAGDDPTIENLAVKLTKEIGRAGWDVSDADVVFRTRVFEDRIVRYISSITMPGTSGLVRLDFHLSGRGEARLWRMTTPPGFMIDVSTERPLDKHVSAIGKIRKCSSEEYANGGVDIVRDVGRFRNCGYWDRPVAVEVAINEIEHLLERMRAHPSAPGPLIRLSSVEKISAPPDFPVLYVWTERENISRFAQGRNGLGDDSLLSGNGYRLVNLDIPIGPCPRRAYDGFDYASPEFGARAGHPVHEVNADAIPVRVNLKYLNEIYVVDAAVYEKSRDTVLAEVDAGNRDGMTGDEFRSCMAQCARGLTPVADYDGSFSRPLYLIGRRLRADEARVMRGPVEIRMDEEIRIVVTDEASGLEYDADRWNVVNEETCRRARKSMTDLEALFRFVAIRDNLSHDHRLGELPVDDESSAIAGDPSLVEGEISRVDVEPSDARVVFEEDEIVDGNAVENEGVAASFGM